MGSCLMAVLVGSQVVIWLGVGCGVILLLAPLVVWLAGARYIPHNKVGVIEKLWSSRGSVGEGRLMASRGEAGYQLNLLRGGVHFGYWPWQYRIQKTPLMIVPQGKIGYVFARDGQPLGSHQTLARVVPSNDFQDARAFLFGKKGEHAYIGQRGR